MLSISKVVAAKFGERAAQLYRFILVGGLVTVLSLALSYLFLKVLHTPLVATYILLYVGTIFVSYLLNSSYTFAASRDWVSLIKFYGSYILTLVLGTLALTVLRRYLPYENWILVFIIVPFTMITNFALSSLIFKKRPNASKELE